MRRFGALLVASWSAGVACAGAIVVLQHQPGDATRPWNWQKIIEQLPAVRAAGYTAILISPHQSACGGQWSLGYDPYDFRNFDSAHGSQQQLAALIKHAHALQVQVYADMVMNHLCTNSFRYPRFGPNDFHRNGRIEDWNDEWQLENRALIGLDDLAQESPYVRGELFRYLVKTNNMGFDGYRWDAAKHVPRWFWQDHVVNNTRRWGKYSFGEQNTLASGGHVNRWKDTDTIVFTRGARLLAGINQRGEPVTRRVQTNWHDTELHDYSGHVGNLRTDAGGWVDLPIPALSYVMMAPLR